MSSVAGWNRYGCCLENAVAVASGCVGEVCVGAI